MFSILALFQGNQGVFIYQGKEYQHINIVHQGCSNSGTTFKPVFDVIRSSTWQAMVLVHVDLLTSLGYHSTEYRRGSK